MVELELTKEELENYLFNLETIGMGSNGLVQKLDDDTCIKIYYKDIYDVYSSKDINLLDDIIERHKKIKTDLYDNERQKLELLTQMGYITKVLYYKGYKIAVEMKLYKDYVMLYDAIRQLDTNKKELVYFKIKNKMSELINNNIYPIDLSTANILVNLESLDVVFIDLDDFGTRYDTDDFFADNPLVKRNLLLSCNSRLREIKEAFENKTLTIS